MILYTIVGIIIGVIALVVTYVILNRRPKRTFDNWDSFAAITMGTFGGLIWPLTLICLVIYVIIYGMTITANKFSEYLHDKADAKNLKMRQEEDARVQRAKTLLRSK